LAIPSQRFPNFPICPYNGFETAPSQMEIGGKVNSRWLQAPDLDLFSGFSDVMEPCSV